MNRVDWLGRILIFIAVATVISGAVQLFFPRLVLSVIGGQNSPTSAHFFSIIGMFMVLFGGLAWQGVLSKSPPALLWSGLQKLGAAGAVGLGVYHQLFAPLAFAVAGFDLLSGLLILLFWRTVARDG